MSDRLISRSVFCRAAACAVLVGLPLGALSCASGAEPVRAQEEIASQGEGAIAAVASSAAAECNPLGFEQPCMLPYPSAYYEAADTTSATGVRVALPASAMPVSRGAFLHVPPTPVDPAAWNRFDGFSAAGPIVAWFPEELDPASLVGPSRIAISVTCESPTLLVDVDTAECIPHISEVDATSPSEAGTVVIVRPVRQLDPGHTYAVAFTRHVRTLDGQVPARPPGFIDLLDGNGTVDPRLARVAPRYPRVLAALARAGVAPDQLVLAWDFDTASEAALTGTVRAMRDDGLAWAAATPLSFTVTQIEDGFNARIARRIRGTFHAPLFSQPDPATDPGRPTLIGTHEVPFVAMVPNAAAGHGPLPLMLVAHGLLGSAQRELGEASDAQSFIQTLAADGGYVVIASDWTGLSQTDVGQVVSIFADANRVTQLTRRMQQTMVDQVILLRTARQLFGRDPAFTLDGREVIDGERSYFVGASQGGILGGTFLGISPDCDRGVLHAGAGNWSLIMARSDGSPSLMSGLGDYPTSADRQLVLSLLQARFDEFDSINFASHLRRDPWDGMAPKQVLVQEAVGDTAVTNLATEALVRTIGIPALAPSVTMPWGIPLAPAPRASALSIWNESPAPLPPETNVPPVVNSTHTHLRTRAVVQQQVLEFLRSGNVIHTCNGACDPE